MITGTHQLLSSCDPESDRAFFHDVLGFAHVDAGEGWLIFALPLAKMGIHQAESNLTHPHGGQNLAACTIYLMCDQLRETLDLLASRGSRISRFRRQVGES